MKRVCVFGPESTGKSTLARRLAAEFDTVYVAEFAREWLNPKGGVCDVDDIPIIARGQAASEDALARKANRILFCDTDLLLTTIWSEVPVRRLPGFRQDCSPPKALRPVSPDGRGCSLGRRRAAFSATPAGGVL